MTEFQLLYIGIAFYSYRVITHIVIICRYIRILSTFHF